jgi:hypothetical protein
LDPKEKDKVTGNRQNCKVANHDLYSSSNIRIIHSKKKRWAENMALMWRSQIHTNLIPKPEGKELRGRYKHVLVANIETQLLTTCYKNSDCINLA